MNRWNPCKRRDVVTPLAAVGFTGPFSGGKHQFMVFGERRLPIPSNEECSIAQLRFILRQVGGILGRTISPEEWNRL